ncbi:hypothetical protein NMG60_11018284 [Bertholletia excelsa]
MSWHKAEYPPFGILMQHTVSNTINFTKRSATENPSLSISSSFQTPPLRCPHMGKIWLEVCLISARGLRRSSALFRLQWYAVGWIDPNNKYCTSIDASGNANPVWKTKFSAFFDKSEAGLQDLKLNIEVYSREPVFLREKLLGSATVVLKEFLDKFMQNSEVSKPVEEVGSFQLTRGSSDKPQGFVDISIRISEEREEPGNGEGFKLMDYSSGINLANGYGMSQPHPPQFPPVPHNRPEYCPLENPWYGRPSSLPATNSISLGGPSHAAPPAPSYYQPPRAPPPPPPLSNVGYTPPFFPRNDYVPPSYINMPSSGAAAGRGGPSGAAFGMGMGAGALAAGAMIFGDDLMSGFSIPSGLPDPSVSVVADSPF